MSPDLFTTAEAADYLGVSASFLNNHRTAGNGPMFIRLGRKVLYAKGDLDDFLNQNRRQSTREGV